MQMNLIGEGGNGKVFRYMERNTGLLVAVKHQQVETESHKALVMKEINFMKTLRHVRSRHVLKIFANFVKPYLVDIVFDQCDNQVQPTIYTAMPLYLGDLGTVLPLPSMPITERVMVQIAEGLRYMHSNLVLHRDLKPDNILMVSPEKIKIADYGWATSLKDTESLYGMCGTAAYCAPEAFKNHEKHTTAIDVYSLGAIFYLMV
ncbi:kinase-like domain-containing protein, partial [Usnea florida]